MGFGLAACVGSDPASSDTPGDGGAGSSSDGSSSGATSSSGGTDADVDSGPLSQDAAPPANCPLGCLPPAPMGWTGPSAVFDGTTADKPTACPTVYTQKELEGHQGLHANAAVCDCGSPTVSGAYCTSSVTVHTAVGGCTNKLVSTVDFTSKNCTKDLSGADYGVNPATPTLTSPGTCTFPNATKTLPDKTYDKEDISCGLPQAAAGCENRTDCVATPIPEAPFTRLCIHKDGDELCPSADYAARFVVYKNVDDTRDCSPTCAGTTPTGGTCGTKWGFSAAGSTECTTGTPPATYDPATCVGWTSGEVLNLKGFAPTGLTCTKTTGTNPTGTASSTDPVTFCCNK